MFWSGIQEPLQSLRASLLQCQLYYLLWLIFPPCAIVFPWCHSAPVFGMGGHSLVEECMHCLQKVVGSAPAVKGSQVNGFGRGKPPNRCWEATPGEGLDLTSWLLCETVSWTTHVCDLLQQGSYVLPLSGCLNIKQY